MKVIVLVSGKMQSGKNKFTDICMENLKDFNVSYDYFAKELKDRCKQDFSKLVQFLNSISSSLPKELKDQLYTTDENWYETKNPVTRILLQTYGTDIFRNRVDNKYWADRLIDNLKNSTSDIIFVTDVRFPSEIESVERVAEENDFLVTTLRINRPIDRSDDINNHESETALDNYKYFESIIENNSSLDSFSVKAIEYCEHIRCLKRYG